MGVQISPLPPNRGSVDQRQIADHSA
jgi:hypothetical protein